MRTLAPAALEPAGLRKPASKAGYRKPYQPTLVPETLIPDAVAETGDPDFPGERLMVWLNPRLHEERRRERERLLAATRMTLEKIAASVRAGTL